MQNFEIIHFSLFGLDLQEPMAFVTNLLLASFSFFAAWSIHVKMDESLSNFKLFFLSFALSTFLGALGHVFFQYTAMFGKYPSWIMGVVAGFYAGKSILGLYQSSNKESFLFHFLWVKGLLLLLLSLVTQKFVFVAIDAILTYLLYTGFLSYKMWKNGNLAMKYFFIGVLVLIPSAFIFLLNWNIHLYLNRDDLSHLLMLACVIYFYKGVSKLSQQDEMQVV